MIRINLLGTERKQAKKAPAFDVGQRLTVACSLILVVTVVGIGWWYWTMQNDSARVDSEIAVKTAEAARLQSLLAEVQRNELKRSAKPRRYRPHRFFQHGLDGGGEIFAELLAKLDGSARHGALVAAAALEKQSCRFRVFCFKRALGHACVVGRPAIILRQRRRVRAITENHGA